jgi:hypothetical protein
MENQNSGCLGLLLRLVGTGIPTAKPASETIPFPYRIRDDFLSAAELSFYRVLVTVVAERAVLCPKVGLGDLFFVIRPQENRAAFNRISQKHVDFVLCDPATMKPILGIELDDSSHARSDRQARDGFVDQVFAAAHLPLIRVPVQRGYAVQDLAARIDPLLSASALSAAAQADVSADDQKNIPPDPLCPKCGVPMVVRQAARRSRQGQTFFGCPNYPTCRETNNNL